MSVHKQAIADLRKLREVSEKNAQKKLAETAVPKIKEFLDRKFSELSEQQLASLGPEGFPYEDRPVKTSTSSFGGGSNVQGVPVPMIGASASDVSQGSSNSSFPIDSVAVPQTSGISSTANSSFPEDGSAGAGVLLDLDAVAAEINKLMTTPVVPTNNTVQFNEPVPASFTTSIIDPGASVVNPSSEVIDDADDNFIRQKSKSEFEEETKNKRNRDFMFARSSYGYDDDDDDDNVIYIEPGLAFEHESKNKLNTIFERLEKLEEAVDSIRVYSEPSKLIRSVSSIQETAWDDIKTLKKEIRDGFKNEVLSSEHFVALYEVVSKLENTLKDKINEAESTEFSIEIEDKEDEESKDSKDATNESLLLSALTEVPEEEECVVYDMSNIIASFGGGHVPTQKTISKNGTTGPMTQDEVVYEIRLRGKDENKKQEAILENRSNNISEEKQMANERDEVIEISDAELRKALRKIRENSEVLLRADGGSQPDPVVKPLPKDLSALLEPGDVDFEEVEADELGHPFTRADKMPKGVSETVSRLKRQVAAYAAKVKELDEQLAEAHLTNAKLIHANKLIQAKDLKLEEKRRIAKAIDKAESVREVKLVFDTIMEQVGNATATNLKEGQVRAGASSRVTTKSGSVKAEPESLNENSDFERMKRLAGMK